MSCSRTLALIAASTIGLIMTAPTAGQTTGRKYPEGMAPPPVKWKGLVAGIDNLDDAVKARLGEHTGPLDWYSSRKHEFKVPGSDLTDNIHMRGDTMIDTIEAVTPPEGCETVAAVRAKLGEPEHVTILSKQRIISYAGKGFRFVANNADGKIVGVACFPPKRHVPEGEPKVCDSSKQKQGPLPPVSNAKPWEGLKVGFSVVPLGLDEKMLPTLKASEREYKIHDVLQARCCYLSYQGTSVALVGADIFGMLGVDLAKLRAKLAEEGHPNVVVAMSHTHAAPDTIGVYGFYPKEYVQSVKQALYQSVKDAAKAAKPVAQVKVVSVDLPLDGARVAEISRNCRNPGLVNPQLAVLTFHGADGKVLGTIVHYACHPETLDAEKHKMFSADYVGPLRDYVDKALGGTTVFLNGALGGMVSGDSPGRRPVDIKLLGEKLAKYVVEYAEKAQPTTEHTLRFVHRPIQICPTNIKFKAMAALKGGKAWLTDGRIPTELNYIRIGSAELITIPGELLPEIGFDIQARMTGYPRMIVCLANDELGYIVPGYDFNEKDYEEGMSVGAAMGPMIRLAAYQLAEQGAK
ncbi:MAG: hypothetical protein JXQ73_05625 [Phycisphaerae bacterium]|nr:hypothetical protein [Phycisphaerae bacterium]